MDELETAERLCGDVRPDEIEWGCGLPTDHEGPHQRGNVEWWGPASSRSSSGSVDV